MPLPGWYPDPDGTPQRLRYWDGHRWTEHVQGAPAPSAPSRNVRPMIVVGVIAAALVLVIGMIAATTLLAPRLPATPAPNPSAPGPRGTPASSPTIPAPFPTPARPSSAAPSNQQPTLACPTAPITASELTDGFLRLELTPGWSDAAPQPWLRCGAAAAFETSAAWASLAVGRSIAPADNGSLEDAADAVLQLALLDSARSSYLEITSRATLVDAQPAWRMDARVGDSVFVEVVRVVVVDNGSDTPSVVLASALEDDTDAMAAMDEALASARVR